MWSNMGGTKGIYFFRRLFITVLGILIIVFLSTPAAVFSSLMMNNMFKHMFRLDWTDELPHGHMIKTIVPPLFIMMINQVLLYLISFSAFHERHFSYSKY